MMMRKAVHENRKLRSSDAIHLATAKNIGAASFKTYDSALLNWDGIFLPIKRPASEQPILPNMPDRQ